MQPKKPNPLFNASSRYQIRVRGHLKSDWFSEFAITHDETGNTIINGEALDQSALHGLLKRIRDSGAELISVNPVNE